MTHYILMDTIITHDKNSIEFQYNYMEIDMLRFAEPDDEEETDDEDAYDVPNDPVIIDAE